MGPEMYFCHREIMSCGVDPQKFSYFLQRLKDDGAVPPKKVMPEFDYKAISDYLQEQGVLSEENQVIPSGLEDFVGRIGKEATSEAQQREMEEKFLRRLREREGGVFK